VGEGDARPLTEKFVPLGRVGYPEDIGKLACWLASDEAEYITGTYNLIDGGLADKGDYSPTSQAGQVIQFIRDARTKMPGDQLLATIDAMTQEAMAEGNRLRKERGLQ